MSDSSVNGDVGPAATKPSCSPNAKRKASDAGLPATGTRLHKSVKRRASKACQSCRARKVRCNVVEQSPCTNCRLDEVECIVSESKRKKSACPAKFAPFPGADGFRNRKWTKGDEETQAGAAGSPQSASASAVQQPAAISFHDSPGHLPHSLCSSIFAEASRQPADFPRADQDLDPHSFDQARRQSMARSISIPQDPPEAISLSSVDPNSLFGLQPHSPPPFQQALPAFIRALPSTFDPEDLSYLSKKGALTLPPPALRNALLRCFVENIHPFMPLLDIHELIRTVDTEDTNSAISLLLFQAIMFAGVASVDMAYLQTAGYTNRRIARRDFFQKTRVCCPLSCNPFRLVLMSVIDPL